ncbi:MAG: hypothetical protein SFU25_10810, partial [Candidatus Caenarcaniphilales bacterium]|nr:hypothetical protein [Candidatus Caenarcaniphilales bacterium]
ASLISTEKSFYDIPDLAFDRQLNQKHITEKFEMICSNESLNYHQRSKLAEKLWKVIESSFNPEDPNFDFERFSLLAQTLRTSIEGKAKEDENFISRNTAIHGIPDTLKEYAQKYFIAAINRLIQQGKPSQEILDLISSLKQGTPGHYLNEHWLRDFEVPFWTENLLPSIVIEENYSLAQFQEFVESIYKILNNATNTIRKDSQRLQKEFFEKQKLEILAEDYPDLENLLDKTGEFIQLHQSNNAVDHWALARFMEVFVSTKLTPHLEALLTSQSQADTIRYNSILDRTIAILDSFGSNASSAALKTKLEQMKLQQPKNPISQVIAEI